MYRIFLLTLKIISALAVVQIGNEYKNFLNVKKSAKITLYSIFHQNIEKFSLHHLYSKQYSYNSSDFLRVDKKF